MSSTVRFFSLISVILFLDSFLDIKFLFAQNINAEKFQYISPVPSSKLNSTETNIIIRFENTFDQSILNKNALYVKGSISGIHSGKVILAENNSTLIFRPHKHFADGEIVTVELNKNLKAVSGNQIPDLHFWFETSKVNLNKMTKTNLERYLNIPAQDFNRPSQNIHNQNVYITDQGSLPEDFPEYVVNSFNNPSPGYIFFTPFKGSLPTYLIIADNYGVPVFYRKVIGRTFDFKKQPTGVLTYFEEGKNQYYVLDSSYNIIDTLQMLNGYSTDLHELVILENGHALMMSYDEQEVSMDTIVAEGNSNAAVIGLVIQELDEDKNVIFQWRSWDHFQITDATNNIDLTDSTIDYVHGNAIEVDYDGNILISSRHMDEITKINRETGEIIWRWGGEHCENNEFTFTNDPIGFSHQHDIRRLPSGNLTLFDNGNLHDPQFSRAVEYQLDEVNKTATLIWEYRNDPETYNLAMGSARRLDSQNTIIGWGYNVEPPAISEVRKDGEVIFYLTLPNTNWNYRAFKFPWKTNLFVTNPDSLFFGNISIGDSLVKSLDIINNSDQEIEINGLLNRDSSYQINISLPLTIPAFDTATIQVTFKPTIEGNHTDDLHLQWNKENERIAQVIPMSGTTDSTSTFVESGLNELDYSLSQNYPNPFNPSTKISFELPEEGKVLLKVYDILGRKIKTLVNKKLREGSYDVNFNAKTLPSGVYFYSLSVNDYTDTKKMILLR